LAAENIKRQIVALAAGYARSIRSAATPEDVSAVVGHVHMELESIQAHVLDNSEETLACKKGCALCCYLTPEVKAHELIRIIDFVEAKCGAQRIEEIRHQAERNRAVMEGLSHRECLSRNIRCPLLDGDDGCSCYPVRPSRCRVQHSTDVSACEAAYAAPSDLSLPGAFNRRLRILQSMAAEALDLAFAKSGFDAQSYYLSHALVEGLGNAAVRKRWRKGKAAFSKAARVRT
jgi:Fe-S-cluster containining protein